VQGIYREDYFPNGCVCTLSHTVKYRAIHEMIAKLPLFRCIGDTKAFEKDVVKRERMQSTGLGWGVAVAHGISCTGAIGIGLGISPKGIDYNAIDRKPVHLLFMIATPPHREEEYLHVLSALVKLLRKPEFRSCLLKLPSMKKKEGFLRQAFASQLALETG